MSEPLDLEAIRPLVVELGQEKSCGSCRWLSEANKAKPRSRPTWPCPVHDPYVLAQAVPALVAEVERLRAEG